MLISTVLIRFAVFLYGWTADKHVFWIAPIIGTGLVGLGLLATFMPIQTYLVDAFTVYAASALAANTVLRSLLGALLPLAGQKMYATLGLGWGNSLLAFIALAMCPIPWVFYRYGERIRKSPRFQQNWWGCRKKVLLPVILMCALDAVLHFRHHYGSTWWERNVVLLAFFRCSPWVLPSCLPLLLQHHRLCHLIGIYYYIAATHHRLTQSGVSVVWSRNHNHAVDVVQMLIQTPSFVSYLNSIGGGRNRSGLVVCIGTWALAVVRMLCNSWKARLGSALRRSSIWLIFMWALWGIWEGRMSFSPDVSFIVRFLLARNARDFS